MDAVTTAARKIERDLEFLYLNAQINDSAVPVYPQIDRT